MKITNRMNLPAPLVRAVSQDIRKPYDPKTEGKIGVGSLCGPPRILQLRRRHWDELTEDAADLIWALHGNAVHACAQGGGTANDLTEEKIAMEVQGIRIRGIADLYTEDEGGTIWDYKNTTAGMLPFLPNQDWITQLNIYGRIYESLGFPVRALRNIALLRDWNRRLAKYTPGYPKVQVSTFKIPIWPAQKTDEYIAKRLEAHLAASAQPDSRLPLCTREEFWGRDETVALYLGETTRATKLFKVKSSLKAAATAAFKEAITRGASKYRIGYRPPTRVRCEEFCPVARFCSQYQESKKNPRDLTFKLGGVEFTLANEAKGAEE